MTSSTGRRLLLIGVVFGAAPLAGQGPTIAPSASVLFAAAAEVPGSWQDTLDLEGARKRGGTVGALVGGVVGATLSVAYFGRIGGDPCADVCEDRGFPVRTVVAGIVGAAAGAGVGYLLGRSIPAHRPDPRPQLEPQLPPVHDTGIKWWQGALIGGVIGGVGAPMVVKSFRLDERGGGIPAVAFVPLGAIIGLMVGGASAQGH